MSWEDDNFASTQLLMRKKVEKEWEEKRASNFKEDIEKDTGVNCSWCGERCLGWFYKCIYHKKSFCKECALKTGDIPTKEFPKCLHNSLNKKDCIWGKIE